MNIHQLTVFVSVFKNKSFSKASDKLQLTQPTISNHIKLLEDELDCTLKLSDIQMRRRFYIMTHKKRTLPRAYDMFLKNGLAEWENL